MDLWTFLSNLLEFWYSLLWGPWFNPCYYTPYC